MSGHPRRAVPLVAGATLGVYALVMVGATASIADAALACSTWPTCGGRWFVSLDDPRLAIAWGHRALALFVGLAVVAAAVSARHAARRVRAALVSALVLYPVQIGLGALAAGGGASSALSVLHLLVGMTIFAALVLALAWSLEAETAGLSIPATSEAEAAAPAATRSPPITEPAGVGARTMATLRAYASLTKPRLMWLLCLVASAGMALAAGGSLVPRTVVATLGGGVLAIGASGTFNHVLERDVDRRMRRTADRPLATDRIPPRRALAFGLILAAASVITFLTINLLAAALGLAAIAYYSVVYTLLLKPNTVQNTVIGGLAGSFPAVIGAAAATNAVGPPALLLAAVIFLWTPAHFYNLALAYRDDYAQAGFPMFPVVKGEAAARKHVLLYLGATLAAAALLSAVGGLGVLYAATGVAFGAVFLWAVVRLHRTPSRAAALRAFHASNAYLGALLVAIVIDAIAV